MGKSDDAWSSLDERDDSDSFLAPDESDYSSSDSSSVSGSSSSDSSSSYSSSSEDAKVAIKRKLSKSAVSTRDTSPVVPPRTPRVKEASAVTSATTSKKDQRRMLLESLAKKRRLSSGARLIDVDESDSSISDDSDNFVVSDNEIEEYSSAESASSGSSSDAMDGPGFYSRISEMISRKERKDKSICDTMSTREAFKAMISYFAIRLVSWNCEFPEKSKKFRKQLPTFLAAVNKIERELLTRRDISKPNYWKPTSLFVQAIETYPDLHLVNMRNYYAAKEMEEECEACHRKGWTTDLSFRGTPYGSKSLWSGNLKKWLNDMRLPLLGQRSDIQSSRSESSSCESSDSASGPDKSLPTYISSGKMLGTQCAFNVRVYHALHHFKHKILLRLYNWIVNQRLSGSIEQVLEALEAQKDHIVEEWYSAYERVINLSEVKFDKFTDPLGNYSPTNDARKSISINSERRRRNSSRF